jgi:GDP-L-fucose synthase
VIPGLIHKCHLAKENDTIFDVWGDGLAQREFLYNKDLGKIIDWMLLEYDSPESLIVSPDMEHAIVEAVVLITKAFDFSGSVNYDSSKPKGQHRKPSDNSKFKELRPDFEFTPLNTGINETVDWFTKNYGDIRK